MTSSSDPRSDHFKGDTFCEIQLFGMFVFVIPLNTFRNCGICFVLFNIRIFIDSAHALFVRATYLVCHRLISSWKTDLNVSLAALELLSGLARIHIRESGI